MTRLENEIEKACELAVLNYTKLDTKTAENVWHDLMDLYCFTNSSSKEPWEQLKAFDSIHFVDSWTLLEECVNASECIFLTRYGYRIIGYLFDNSTDLVKMYDMTDQLFEFYVTDYSLNYLFCYNHHDYLIACGTAIDWLREKKKSYSSFSE